MFSVNQKSVQIDHVYINSTGIYVIETKNYAGRIYGKEEQDQWTQVLAYGKVKNHFYSPIKQNNGHIYSLNQVLKEFPNVKLFSIIVFMQTASLFIESVTPVITIRELRNTIKKSSNPFILTESDIDKVYSYLINLKDSNDITLNQHVKQIRKRKENYENNICPYCGGQLVLRQGKSGSFYGCTNYPKCKFTKTDKKL
jgi:hypothetical protein